MAGILVEHARFVEVQQRRARVVAELTRPPETPAPRTASTSVDQVIDVGDSPIAVAARPTRGAVDVR